MTFQLKSAAAAAFALAILGASGPSPLKAAKPVFQPADVFALVRATDVQIAPDGRDVAYVRHDTDISIDGERRALIVVNLSSGQQRKVAAGGSMPRWSPDGRQLAYVADDNSIVVQDMSSNAVRRLTAPGVSPAALSWSPSGALLAYTAVVAEAGSRYLPPVAAPSRARWAAAPRIVDTLPFRTDGESGFTGGHRQLFVVSYREGAIRQLTTGDADVDGTPAWHADAGALIFSSMRGDRLTRTYMSARLYRVSVGNGSIAAVSTDGLGAREPAVSPDGRWIAFIGSRRGDRSYSPGHLYIVPIAGGIPRRLGAELDREVGQPRFAADQKSVFASFGDRGRETLGRFRIDGGVGVVARDLVDGFSLDRRGIAAFVSGDTAGPGDVAIADGGAVRELTALNRTLLDARDTGSLRPLSTQSSLDGARVEGWLLLPPHHDGGRRYPMIVALHGGPYGFDAPVWRTDDRLLAAAGYVVLRVNYRGSTSYGFAFADRIARDYPGPAFADVMSAVDRAVADAIADPQRLFITGGSAGGEITAWAVGSTRRFRAAVVVKPVINQVSQALTSDQFAASSLAIGGTPWDDPTRYWRQSPLSRVGNVGTPTMLIVGEQDHRTPAAEAVQFYTALKTRRVPTMLALFPDAGHESIGGRPSRIIATTGLSLDWFARYGGSPSPRVVEAPGSVVE